MRVALLLVALPMCLVNVALANHDTDCTGAGGTNGPAQLDCTLPDFIAHEGSTTVLKSSFVYTPSTDRDPPTCAVGTMSVDPAGQWLAIDTTVLNASSPMNFQEVEVLVDPTGLTTGIFEGFVRINLTIGPNAPQCPSGPTGLNGMVFVRLVVLAPIAAPVLNAPTLLAVAGALAAVGIFRVWRRRSGTDANAIC